MVKIIRTICYFTCNPGDESTQRLSSIGNTLSKNGYEVQTKRICSKGLEGKELGQKISDDSIMLSLGSLNSAIVATEIDNFLSTDKNLSFNLDLTKESILEQHVNFLFKIIQKRAEKTFNFAFVFNNQPSSPFFPSATYGKEGFSIGLQPTNLSINCNSLKDWLNQMKAIWNEVNSLFKLEQDYLGIDSSIAPLFEKESSFINFIKRLGVEFGASVTTDIYTKISRFIKEQNPNPIGLCGLMFPCLEDFELAHEYEKGNFSIERNIFLSLHSGLGIDTYPIAVNQDKKEVMEILGLIQALSNKYKKPLSIRFVSDGKAKIGEKTNFQNQYLKDVVIRSL